MIDAGEELDRLEQDRVEGDYGASELGSERRQSAPGARMFLIVVLVAILAVGAAFTYKAMSNLSASDEDETKKQDTVSKVIPTITPRPIRPEPAPTPAPVAQPIQPVPSVQPTQQTVYGSPAAPAGPRQKTQAELIRERMLQSGLQEGSGADLGAAEARAMGGGQGGGSLTGGGSGELAEKLQPMRLAGSKAGQLPNRDLLLTQGAMIDCVLETKMVTTQPGMTKCRLTRDIYSASGRVVLLDRGTIVTGFYQGGITQGQARIFVQWSRAETPKGVIVDLASPGTGPLGEAGVGGWIDTHFWQRFGGAVFISMIGDLGQWASQAGRSSGDNSVQFSNTAQGTEQAAAEALRNSVNIPPTLYKNQGERVSIFVARDLDFSDVYSLRANYISK
ncbi:type IV secretion system protein VirB10 [Brucella cytisi]